MKLAQRVQNIRPSPTLAVSGRALRLQAEGRDIISLAAGEPDFDTPQHIKDAAIAAIQSGLTKYTAVDGTPGLKQAIAGKLRRENRLDYALEEILVSVGCKHSLYNLTQALLNPGDEVIIPAPYWVSYPDMVRLAGAEPVFIHTTVEDEFRISPGQLRGAISERTRLLILNSPANPTGTAYGASELAALAEVLLEHPEIVIASDDIYEHVLWTGDGFRNIVNVAPELKPRTVVVNGVSKAYAMTGWRIGYAAGEAGLIKAMQKIQSQSTSNPASIAQAAAEAALNGEQGYIEESTAAFKRRHDYVRERLLSIPGVACMAAHGTFYSFPDMKGVIERLDGIGDDIALAEYCLDEAEVAMVPGSAFGAPGCMRLSFATSDALLEKAMDRLVAALG